MPDTESSHIHIKVSRYIHTVVFLPRRLPVVQYLRHDFSAGTKNGSKAPDIVIKVPVGTEIVAEDGETVLADMVKPGQIYLAAKGGDGGRGNTTFKSATNQAPRYAEAPSLVSLCKFWSK